jgi:hypothetical protein
LPRLAYLDLCQLNPTADDFAELLDSPLGATLRVLRLSGPGRAAHGARWVSGNGAIELAKLSQAAGLVWLDLGNQSIGDAGTAALVTSRHLQGLQRLDLWANRITDVGGRSLANWKKTSSLTTLDVRCNDISDKVRQRLRARFGAGVRYGPGPTPPDQRRHTREYDEEFDDDLFDDLDREPDIPF